MRSELRQPICTKFFNLVDESFRDDYIAGIRDTIEACKIQNVTSTISQTGNKLEGVPRKEQRSVMVETLKRCAPLLEEAGIVLEVEPLNGLVDH
ncbi:TIM barrel protein [Paenibacillus alvei]|uniref:TIM barrel protein n=1 Tax=Paenibacillus alvei TaxID=44250 RepID=UPI003D2B0A3B